MQEDGPKLLVVANPDDGPKFADLLVEAGLPQPEIGTGNDETLELHERLDPDVVVLCAGLERGDAHALAAAIRGGPRGDSVKIVLVGEERGPIRNALDAADFDVDRFVGRPLSPKALVFAVRKCAELAASERSPAPEDTERRIEEETDRAIDDFVRSAMDALSAEPAPVEEGAPAGEDIDAGWEDSAPIPREPTLILSGGGAASAERASGQVTERGEEEDVANAATHLADEPDLEAPADDLGDLAEDLEEPRAANGSGEAMGERTTRGAGEESDTVSSSGGSFARELRRKMSAMAQRLFPGEAKGADSPVDVGLSHDAHTEIDLTQLGFESTSTTSVPYQEIGGADTFADTNPREPLGGAAGSSPGLETDAEADSERVTTGRREGAGEVPARGELGAARADVATLLARFFAARFTGRVIFRQPPAEKVLYVEDGRPVFASSNLPHDRMGDLLYREGKITREQHVRSRDLVVESGRRMGEVLVELGFLKPRELLPAVRRHIEDIIYSLFAWTGGEFAAAPGETSGERIRLSRHPAALVLEGVRRKYGLELLEERLGSAQAVVQIKSSSDLSSIIGVTDLNDAEHRVIEMFDGERSVEDAAGASGLDLLNAMQLAFGLVALGAAEILHRGDEALTQPDAGRSPSLVGETDLAIDRQRVLAKYELVAEADYFMLLGVRRDATSFEIKRAYEAARRDYASEAFPSEVRRELAEEIDTINQMIDEAYEVLRDDRLRRSYLTNLRD